MSKKLISLLLTIVLFTTVVCGSYADSESVTAPEAIQDDILEKGLTVESKAKENEDKSIPDEADDTEKWEEYIGNIEAFTYGLIIRQLEYSFDAFPACIDLPNGNEVYGIAYTDYTECYTNEDETKCLFEAGFIPFNDELPVSQEDFDLGLNIYSLEYTDDQTMFRWTYRSDSFRQHCVIYNQYLQYGVDESGTIFYEASEYIPGICDESIGSLYSYDEARYLFDIDVGTYIGITGESLFSFLDFDEFEKEVNRILQEQDTHFATVDIASCASFSQEAIISYLLSLQDETFLGYEVQELVAAAETLDPLECYRITSDGLITLQLQDGNKASELTKWLVGTGCTVLVIAALASSVIFLECPALSSLSGAVAGLAIETFMQVVIAGKDLDSVDWRKVALGAAAGALSGLIGPYLYATCDGFVFYALDTAVDGLIGAAERAAEAWMDGKDAAEIKRSFGDGFIEGLAFSAGIKVLGSVGSQVLKRISPGIKKASSRLLPKMTRFVSECKSSISSVLETLKKAADSSVFHSSYISRKISAKQVARVLSQNKDEILDDSIKQLPPDDLYDTNDLPITKDAIRQRFKKADEGDVIAYIKKGDETIRIVKDSNIAGIKFDPEKYLTETVPERLTHNRSDNFKIAAETLKNKWIKDATTMPSEILDAINNHSYTLEDISPSRLVSLFQENGWTIHENADMFSFTLVPTDLHMHVSHMGAVGLAKFIESHVTYEYFDRLISFAATGAVIADH